MNAGRVDRGGRLERDGDTVETQARFIDKFRVEDMSLAEGADLTMRGSVISKSGNAIPLQGRLGALVLLKRIETVQRISRPKLMRYVPRVLINLHGARGEGNIIVSAIR